MEGDVSHNEPAEGQSRNLIKLCAYISQNEPHVLLWGQTLTVKDILGANSTLRPIFGYEVDYCTIVHFVH